MYISFVRVTVYMDRPGDREARDEGTPTPSKRRKTGNVTEQAGGSRSDNRAACHHNEAELAHFEAVTRNRTLEQKLQRVHERLTAESHALDREHFKKRREHEAQWERWSEERALIEQSYYKELEKERDEQRAWNAEQRQFMAEQRETWDAHLAYMDGMIERLERFASLAASQGAAEARTPPAASPSSSSLEAQPTAGPYTSDWSLVATQEQPSMNATGFTTALRMLAITGPTTVSESCV
jgi:hypothetical protein